MSFLIRKPTPIVAAPKILLLNAIITKETTTIYLSPIAPIGKGVSLLTSTDFATKDMEHIIPSQNDNKYIKYLNATSTHVILNVFDDNTYNISYNSGIKMNGEESSYFINHILQVLQSWINKKVDTDNKYIGNIDTASVNYVQYVCLEYSIKAINKILSQNKTNVKGGGSITRTNQKVDTKQGKRCVYVGNRGGKYVKEQGKFVPLRQK